MRLSPSPPPHGGQLRQISERFGIPASQLLDFSANINPQGPPPSVLQALQAALASPAMLTSYPDLEQAELKSCIAASAGVDAGAIAVANGFVPLLEAALRTLSVRRCLLPVPAFREYRGTLERVGVAVTPYRLPQETGFDYDPEEIIALLETGRHDAILLANPQNPAGALCDRNVLLEIVRAGARANVHVLLDEAFIDYASEHSVADQVDHFTTLTVFRSVTKFYAIPGLRVAYAISNPEHTARLNSHLPPWPITTFASIGVCAALRDTVYAKQTLAANLNRKGRLVEQLQELGLYTYPSAANFLLFRLPRGIDAEEYWQRLIVEYSIVLRECSNFETLISGHLRCAVRAPNENVRLVSGLRSLLNNAPCSPGTFPHDD
jgi:threonine-phosphate decarboxylase